MKNVFFTLLFSFLFAASNFAQCEACAMLGSGAVFIIPGDGVYFCETSTTCVQVYSLPIELTKFDGNVNNSDVQLSWTTESETNNEGFEIQRSYNGSRFETIGTIAGAGTTTETKNYTFTDRDIKNITQTPNLYYRLKQIDFDRTETFTDIIALEIGATNELTITSIVNTDGGANTTLKFSSANNKKVNITLFDMGGRVILKSTIQAIKGINETNLDLDSLQRGLYIISVDDGRNISTQKLIK